jgi:predicted ATPase
LAEREKRLLQTASVIGKDFPETLLAAVAELSPKELRAALTTLSRAEFICTQASRSSTAGFIAEPLDSE